MNFEEVNEEQAEKNDYLVGCPLRPTEEKWSSHFRVRCIGGTPGDPTLLA